MLVANFTSDRDNNYFFENAPKINLEQISGDIGYEFKVETDVVAFDSQGRPVSRVPEFEVPYRHRQHRH